MRSNRGLVLLLSLLLVCVLLLMVGCGPVAGDGNDGEPSEEVAEPALPAEEERQAEQEGEEEQEGQEEIADTANGAREALSLAEQMRDDNLLQVLDMSKEDVLSLLGEPDMEDWWAGPYLYYEDASSFIEPVGQGVTDQRYLWIWIDDDDNVVITHLSFFAGVEAGMSFKQAMDILGQEMDVMEDQEWGEFGNYYMTYQDQGYSVSFYSYEGAAGPIEEIFVEKAES